MSDKMQELFVKNNLLKYSLKKNTRLLSEPGKGCIEGEFRMCSAFREPSFWEGY